MEWESIYATVFSSIHMLYVSVHICTPLFSSAEFISDPVFVLARSILYIIYKVTVTNNEQTSDSSAVL